MILLSITIFFCTILLGAAIRAAGTDISNSNRIAVTEEKLRQIVREHYDAIH